MEITDEMLYQQAAEARDIWLGTLPEDGEIPEYNVSRKFERKMRKLLKEQRRSRKMNRTLRIVKRSVAVAVIALVVAFGGLMTVEAYREKVIEVVIQVFHELTEFRFASDMVDAYLPTVEFGYVPEGMREAEYRISGEKRGSILYEDESGYFFQLRLEVITASSSNVSILDTEDAETEYFALRGNDALINTKSGFTSIIWTEHNVLYQMDSIIEPSELIKIAENLKIS